MKKSFVTLWILSGSLSLGLLFASSVHGQTNLQFTAVAATEEQAIRLTWASESNHVYQILYADALSDQTVWNLLYDDYPSHGTNTFWLDTGNYFKVPAVLHPKKMSARFYRIVDLGEDTWSSKPTVSIILPTNGFVTSGNLTITVAASTNQAALYTKLFVDGEEMPPSEDRSNYVINTCEWPNGQHILFATATAQSAVAGPADAPPILVSHGVSPYVPVTFDNLITKISFSEPFFNPAAGQTQQVSAVFAANVDWTLNIRDINSNAVRTVTGSGTSMQFNWDGNGNGGTNLPIGVYHYYISAQTNGQQMMMSSGNGFSSSASAFSATSEEVMKLWALAPESSGPPLPFAIYPPGFNTNGFEIFEASQSEVQALTKAVMSVDKPATAAKSSMLMDSESSGGSANAMDANTPSGQATLAPVRPPPAPMRGIAGIFGIGYQTCLANGTNGYQSIPKPDDGSPLHLKINLEGFGSADPKPKFGQLREADTEAIYFNHWMEQGGWQQALFKDNDNLQISDLRGSDSPFNQVNFAFLSFHGTYALGTVTADQTANGCKQMYFPIVSGTSAQYLRMSEMNWGGDGTNGLKWLALFACHGLNQVNWQNMQSHGVKPYNGNLHLILGSDTSFSVEPNVAGKFAQYMMGIGTNTMTIRNAWYQAARDAYTQGASFYSYVNPTKFVVVGDSACFQDYLQTKTNTVLSGSWIKDIPVQVYP